MVWAILVLLGIPLWLCAAGITITRCGTGACENGTGTSRSA